MPNKMSDYGNQHGIVVKDALHVTHKEMLLEEVIYLAHEVNRAVRGCIGQDPGVPFGDVSPEKKASLRLSVLYAWEFGLSDCDEDSHNRWTYAKLREGWKFGEAEDSEKKTHPNLVPYDDLPWKEQLKDRFFRAIVEKTQPSPSCGEGERCECHGALLSSSESE
jgi:hypothetical protein